ncbi:MAG: hypothetical protein ACLP36_05025 [Acidimicrobiales bacterium]
MPKTATVMAVERFSSLLAPPRREEGPPSLSRRAAACAFARGVAGAADRARCEALWRF